MNQPIPSPAGRHWRQRLVRSSLSLGVRQGLVAALTAIGVLLLSHMLRPAAFAFFGWTTAVATIASAVGDFGYGAALIHSGEARQLAGRAIVRHLRVVVPLAVLACLVLAVLPISGSARTAALLLTVGAALLGAQMLPSSVFEAEGRFAFIGAIEVIQRAVLIGGAVALAAVSHASWAAPAAAVAAAAFGWGAALLTSRVSLRGARASGAIEVLDTHFAHSWFTGRVANHLNYAAYPIIGTAFLSGRQLGLVLWAVQVSAMPALGGQVAARVTFPAMVGDGREQRVETHRRAVSTLVALGGPLVSALIVFAAPIVRLVFGPRWLGAVTVLQIECFNTLLGLVLTPTAPAMYVFAPPGLVRKLMIGYTTLTAVLAVALIGPVGLTAISVATAISSTAMLAVLDHVLRRSGHPGLRFVLPMALVLAASSGVGLAWSPAIGGIPLLIFAAGGWTLAVFALVIGLVRPPVPWDRLRPRRKQGVRCV